MKCRVGLVEDHRLVLKTVAMMIERFKDFEVVLEALSGAELQQKLPCLKPLPDILLIDITMPGMNGVATAQWVKKNYPDIRLSALSVFNSDAAILSMLRAGCCCYLQKNANPDEVEEALRGIMKKGYYSSDASGINYGRLASIEKANQKISEREREFLSYVGSDMPYKEIAAVMGISPRAAENLRENLFKKLDVQSRAALAMESLRRGLTEL